MAFCPNCGAELPEGSGFCGNCGAPVGAPQNQEIEAPRAYRAPRAPRAAAPELKNKKALQIASIIFAIGFLFFFTGLGGRIYTGRVVDKFNTEYAALAGSKLNSTDRGIVIERVAAIARGDAKALYSNEIKSFRAHNPDYEKMDEYRRMTYVPLTSEEVKTIKESIRNVTENAHSDYGFNWTMLTLGAHYSFFMWFGGFLAVAGLAAWILMGGRFSNFLQSTCWPALAACFLLALTIFILDLALNAEMTPMIWNFLRMSV